MQSQETKACPTDNARNKCTVPGEKKAKFIRFDLCVCVCHGNHTTGQYGCKFTAGVSNTWPTGCMLIATLHFVGPSQRNITYLIEMHKIN